ncbi:MlaD family protein [Nocardia acidivorans]|uniref:MlaD family protein n=1 Tax=Nocardia acidivorans TaxID=404580 RepID=UPI000830FE32|nr:MCE family protein [Nocardia acidivorans]
MLLDPSGRGPTARQLSTIGLAVLSTLALLLYLLALRYHGDFEDKVPVVATLTSTGDGLPANADVKFRGMIVGRVAGVDIVSKGDRQNASLWLEPGVAETIPATVTARVIPNNIFGVTAVELVDTVPTTRTLRAGATIAEDTSAATVQLQSTLNVLRTVLSNIQPEKLGRVLGTLSAAFDPEARVPGSTIERLDNWMTQVHALPEMGDLLGNLGRAATALSRSAPQLVEVLSQSVTTAKTLTDQRSALVALLANGGTAVDAVNTLFAANPDSGKFLVSGLDELFGSLAQDPQAIPYAISNLNTALRRLRTVFTFGPQRQMNWTMEVSLTPFQQYVAKDCPHYGNLYGPRCGTPSVADSAPAQEFPAQLLPQRLSAAGPAPQAQAPSTITSPGPPTVPIPGLPSIPGITAPAAQSTTPGADITVGPAALRGKDAVAAVVGGEPNMAQLLLLGPALAGGHVELSSGKGGA